MRKSLKVLTAVAVAGLALAGGSAFTGTGLATSGTAASAQFVGGTVNQSVTGATLSTIAYTFADTTNTSATAVKLTFADATGGKTPTIELNSSGTPITTCSAIDPTLFTSDCSFTGTAVNRIDVTVPSN
jgi:hypothetical protein